MRFNEWEEIRLEELIDIQIDNRGRNPDTYLSYSNYPVIDNYLIKNQRYPDMSKVNRYIDKDNFDNFLRGYIKKDDVLITLVGNGIGNVTMAPSCNSVIIQNTLGLRTNNKASNLFLYYSLLHNQEEIKNFDRGTSQPSIKKTDLFKFELQIPPLKEQISIAHILSTLDEKIETNNQINKKLEEMAQAIFKQWFVDFEFPNEDGEPYKSSGGEMLESELGMIPKGWEVKTIGDYIKFVKGKKPKVIKDVEFEDSGVYLTIDVLNRNSILYGSLEKMVIVDRLDNLMVMDGASSGTLYYGQNGILGSTLSRIDNNGEICNELIYCLLKYYEKDIKENLTGSAIPHTDKNYVYRLQVSIPKNKTLLNKFGNIIKEIREKIIINEEESQKLTNLRDTLLPKLMSGEIRVPLVDGDIS